MRDKNGDLICLQNPTVAELKRNHAAQVSGNDRTESERWVIYVLFPLLPADSVATLGEAHSIVDAVAMFRAEARSSH